MEILIDSSVQRFLDKLANSTKHEDRRLVAEIFHVFDLLKKHGSKLPMPYSRVIRGYQYRGIKLKELRISSHIELRIFYFFIKSEKICVLLHHSIEKSRKLSHHVYETAFKKILSDSFIPYEL